jgi:hypothetical protein
MLCDQTLASRSIRTPSALIQYKHHHPASAHHPSVELGLHIPINLRRQLSTSTTHPYSRCVYPLLLKVCVYRRDLLRNNRDLIVSWLLSWCSVSGAVASDIYARLAIVNSWECCRFF